MKKKLSRVIVCVLCAPLLLGCSRQEPQVPETGAQETETETPDNMASAARSEFWYHTGAPESSRSAFQVGEHDEYGCRFYAAAPFDAVSVSCPSYSDNIGSLTFSLYRWDGNYIATRLAPAVAAETYVDFNDNATLTMSFDECGTGEYLLLLSGGTGGVGVWMFSRSESGTYI